MYGPSPPQQELEITYLYIPENYSVRCTVLSVYSVRCYLLQGEGSGYYPGMYGPSPPQQELEITYLYIPENSVGACIGSKGTNIKEVMRMSGARIKVSHVVLALVVQWPKWNLYEMMCMYKALKYSVLVFDRKVGELDW